MIQENGDVSEKYAQQVALAECIIKSPQIGRRERIVIACRETAPWRNIEVVQDYRKSRMGSVLDINERKG
jgi:hypothetical protein